MCKDVHMNHEIKRRKRGRRLEEGGWRKEGWKKQNGENRIEEGGLKKEGRKE